MHGLILDREARNSTLPMSSPIFFLEKLSKALNCDFDSTDPEPALKCLREKPAEEIVRNQKVAAEFPNLFPFSPTLDGTFLSESPKNLLLSGQVKDAPVLIGTNEEEGTW